MATEGLDHEQEEQQEEHPGGGRFNRLLGITFVAVAMIGGVAIALGVQSSGNGRTPPLRKRSTTQVQQLATRARSRTSPRMAAVHHSAPSSVPTAACNAGRPSAHAAGVTEAAKPVRAMGGREVHEGARSAADGGGIPRRRDAGNRQRQRTSQSYSLQLWYFDRSNRHASSARIAVHRDGGKRDSRGSRQRNQLGSCPDRSSPRSVRMSSTARPESICSSRRAAGSSAFTRTLPPTVSNASRSRGSG